MKKVIVLQHATCETPGTIEGVLIDAGLEVRTVRLYAGEPVPTSLGFSTGLIAMGGPMGVYEQDRFPFLKDELNLIERALADHAPVLGICLGSQLLATALGAVVQKGPRKEIGWHRVSLKPDVASDALFRVSPTEFDAFHWHGDIFELPGKSTSLARSNLTECQAFRYGENAYGILFHLEVTFASVAGMMEAFAEELRAEGIDASELAAQTESALPLLQSIGYGIFRNWAQIP